MNRITYTLLFYLASPLIFLRLWWRSLKSPAYRERWLERLGFYSFAKPQKVAPCIVFHAVSVGEVHAAVPLVQQVQQAFPGCQIVLTTSTPTGSARVKALFGETLQHVYLPYDLPGAVKRFLAFFEPDLIVVMETELWPNLIHYCRGRGCKLMLANARLSAKSLRNYQKVPVLARQMLEGLNVVAAQSEGDGEGFVRLGLPSGVLQITGSVKFDVALNMAQVDAGKALRLRVGDRPVLIAGSTREGEEKKVLDAFAQILLKRPDVLLILVPRHPERLDEVCVDVQNRGLALVRRSSGQEIAQQTQVFLGDSMGEMQFYYSAADLAFVGGSLVDTGCQNIIEPAALGLPVITGPSLFNFRAISQMFIDAEAMQVVEDSGQLAEAVLSLLDSQSDVQLMSQRARQVVELNRGATIKLMALIKGLVSAMSE